MSLIDDMSEHTNGIMEHINIKSVEDKHPPEEFIQAETDLETTEGIVSNGTLDVSLTIKYYRRNYEYNLKTRISNINL